jgi:uncharacterized lipoprotein (TIGR02269 family)
MPFGVPVLRWLSLAALVLSGCGTTSPATRVWEEEAARDDTRACEAPDVDQCVVLACDGEEGTCDIFGCEDVDPEAVVQAPLAHNAELARGGAYRPPGRGPGPLRNWRHMGVREGARPRMTFHFEYRYGFLPAFPRYEGKVVRHHLFPQAQEFRRWFGRAGIDIHQYTLVIPEHIHRQIHGGDGRGGVWNAAWREYVKANPRPPEPEVLLRHALNLAFRFKLVGPIVPYNHPVLPIGPQLYAN